MTCSLLAYNSMGGGKGGGRRDGEGGGVLDSRIYTFCQFKYL